MIFSETPLFDDLKKYFGRDVSFMYNNKVRSGKFILFGSKNSYFNIKVQNSKGIHTYEFPYPYKYECNQDSLFLDYKLKTLINEDLDLLKMIGKFKNKTKAKEIGPNLMKIR